MEAALQISRTEGAYRSASEVHDRIKRLDAEMRQAFEALTQVETRMREEGAGLTVNMSAPLAAALSVWKKGDNSRYDTPAVEV